ncbi:Inositol-1-monophosphatase [compost metagenome]
MIYNPVMDELFTAEKGGGAWLADHKRLRVANRRHLSDAVVSTGIKTQGTSNDTLQLRQLATVNPAVAGIRRGGSISIDMAWLAAGRLDALWEAGLKPWDVAPGLLLVKEAGGLVSDFAGQPGSVWNGQIVAGNEALQGALLKSLRTIQ